MSVIKADRLTRAMLREMKVGEAMTVDLPNGKATSLARGTISQLHIAEEGRWSANVSDQKYSLVITRLE